MIQKLSLRPDSMHMKGRLEILRAFFWDYINKIHKKQGSGPQLSDFECGNFFVKNNNGN